MRRSSSEICHFAENILSSSDFLLVEYINNLLLKGKTRIAWSLLQEIFPKYWTHEGGTRTLWPDDVYRTLYYLTHSNAYLNSTRHMITLMGSHLEGLLYQIEKPNTKSLGQRVQSLRKKGILNQQLADNIILFNKSYVRAKHLAGDIYLPSRLDERTFSTYDTLLLLFIMRQLSIQIMEILRISGNPMPEEWKPFKEEWLIWKDDRIFDPVIPQRQHKPPLK